MNLIVVVVAVMAALVVIRLCGWLLTRIAHEATEWCEMCGIEITEGWVIYEVRPSTRETLDRGGDSGMAAYWCSRHRPADARAVPWCA